MPDEIKDHHLQMLGMKAGRTEKKKSSVTQVQVKKNLEKAIENEGEDNNGENAIKEQD